MNSFLHQGRIATSGFVMFAILSSLILVSFNQGFSSVKTDGESITGHLGGKKIFRCFRPQIGTRITTRTSSTSRSRTTATSTTTKHRTTRKTVHHRKRKNKRKTATQPGGYGERYLRVPGSGVYERRNRRVFREIQPAETRARAAFATR